MIRYVIILSCLFIFAANPTNLINAQERKGDSEMRDGLKLTINSNKEKYKHEEDIKIELLLLNEGKEEVRFVPLFMPHWDIIPNIKPLSSDEEIYFRPPPLPPSEKFVKKSIKTLKPGKLFNTAFDLSNLISRYPQGGIYEIICSYKGIKSDLFGGDQVYDENLWDGMISSNKIQIEIEKAK